MKRSLAVITLALATVSVAVAQRLPEVATPENYKLTFTPDLEKATFRGDETISIRVRKPTSATRRLSQRLPLSSRLGRDQ